MNDFSDLTIEKLEKISEDFQSPDYQGSWKNINLTVSEMDGAIYAFVYLKCLGHKVEPELIDGFSKFVNTVDTLDKKTF